MKNEMLNKILSLIAAALALGIVTVSAVFLIERNGRMESAYRKTDPSPKKIVNMSAGKENSVDAFTDMDQIRVVTKDDDGNSSVVVVTPWFSYPTGDKTLFEELSQKDRLIKSIFVNYFSSMTLNEIRAKGEQGVKNELLKKINGELVMGKIRAVYFDEYIFID
jgi:flagellar FliL protein